MASHDFKFLACLIICLFRGITAQQVTVTGEQWIDVGDNAMLYCTVNVPATPPFAELEWAKSDTSVVDADNAATFLVYTIASGEVLYSSIVNRTRIVFDKMHPQYALTIIGFTEADSGRYWCRAIPDSYTEQFLDVRTRVPPTVSTIAIGTRTLSNGDTVVFTAKDMASFTCTVSNIRPGASFTWTLDTTVLPSTSQPDQSSGDTVTSVNTVQFEVQAEHHSKMLNCRATNKPGDNGIQTGVMLNVNVPPKSVKLSDADGDKTDGDPVIVDEGTPHTFTCLVQGTRPAATIQWFIGNALQSSGDSTSTENLNNGLFDTTGTLTFAPSRADHKKVLKCDAYIVQSQQSNPASSVMLLVNGPPDTPTISGVTSPMTENVVVQTSCVADMGYPDDWKLNWTRGNPPVNITGTTTTTTSSDSNNRYKFTSMLDFTPSRADNGNNITCTAGKDSGVIGPAGTTGPLNVQFCARNVSVTTCPASVKIGVEPSLACASSSSNPAAVLTWSEDSTNLNNPANKVETDGDYGGIVTTLNYATGVLSKSDNRRMLKCCITTTTLCTDDLCKECTLNVLSLPEAPSNVKITDSTDESLTVVWTPGYNGGVPQWFHVRHLVKTPDSTEVPIEGTFPEGTTTYKVTGLEQYTEYEIRVYAINDIGMNPTYGSATGRTLPETPNNEGFTIFNSDDGTVEVDWPSSTPKYKGSCIQLEVKYQGNSEWQKCGNCITSPQTVTLSTWCSQQQRRKRQTDAATPIAVQAKLCYDNGNSCGGPVTAKTVTSDSARNITGLIIGIVVGCLLLMFAAVVLVVFVWKKRRNTLENILPIKAKKPHGHPRKPSDDQSTSHNALDVIPAGHRPFPRDQLTIIKELGHGAFGVVFLAEATGIVERSKTTLVAVKSVKERAGANDKANLIAELELMKKLPDHHNVVKLLGFCVQQDPPYIIVEYLSRGNLKDLLADSRSKGGRVYGNLHGVSKSLTSNDLMKFAVDVADGMQFISSQQCVHRDLAARNVLVAEDMTCKVSDFGLARDVTNVRVYERTSEGNLPLRWMALESILYDTYTTESDAWSYGVLLWEIVTLGARPYPAMSAKTMIGELQSGYRMPKPQHCQQEIYDIMLRCWEEDPDWRPKFETISRKLKTILNKGTECISVKNYEESIYEVTLPKDDNEKV